jgi:hypothetical protein
MATVVYTVELIPAFGERSHVITWTPITAANNVGNALEMPGSSDRSVQLDGTWDSGTVVLQGSNDGTTWFTLTDPQGNAISKTSNALEAISELTRYIRPSSSGGGGSHSVSCRVLLKKVR